MKKNTCPMRIYDIGSLLKLENLDSWNNDSWKKDESILERNKLINEDITNNTFYSEIANYWPWDTNIPRTCSFCGSINPTDTFMLLENGWKIELSTKKYKFYLKPPDNKSPVPCIKAYTSHFTTEEIDILNNYF